MAMRRLSPISCERCLPTLPCSVPIWDTPSKGTDVRLRTRPARTGVYPAGGTRSLNTPVLISVVPSTGKTKPHFGQLSWRTVCSWLNS